MQANGWRALFGVAVFVVFADACGNDEEPPMNGPMTADSGAAPVMSAPGGLTDAAAAPSLPGSTGGIGGATLGGGTAQDAGGNPGAGPDTGASSPDSGGADTGVPDAGAAASGPKNGDPSKPVVQAEGVPCRMSTGGTIGGGGLGSPNAMVGGRELIVDYPCGKHEGAHMTVILNLHGTLIGGAPWQYQRGYFSAYRFVDSHNLIVVHPRSVSTAPSGAQWGNMDNGQDLPHLVAVVDWIYKAFAKFQIRGLWVAGHSWGSGFATSRLGGGPLACNAMLADKVKGAVGMSNLAVPACASKLSLIGTRGETENLRMADQSPVAQGHGCTTPLKGPEMVGNNERRYYEGCQPGWVHEDYHMLGKGHIDSIDQEVVKQIVTSIKSTEP